MTDYNKYATQAQDQIVAAAKQVGKAQEQAIGAFREAQESFGNQLPSPVQVIENTHALTTQMLQVQKDLALRWVESWTPSDRSRTSAKSSS